MCICDGEAGVQQRAPLLIRMRCQQAPFRLRGHTSRGNRLGVSVLSFCLGSSVVYYGPALLAFILGRLLARLPVSVVCPGKAHPDAE